MRSIRVTLAAAIVALAVTSAGAQDLNSTRSLAATCTACHGTDGISAGGVPPGLAGRNKDDLLQQLKDFKAGRRSATVMHQLARGYSDEQLERIAGWFAVVTPGAAPVAPRAGR